MKKTILTVSVILVLVSSILILTGCEKKAEGLVGQWAYGSFVYTFNEDKTGTYDAAGTLMNFTYEDKGTSIAILYTGSTAPLELNYRLEGNKLIVTDSFGSDVEYIRK